MNAPLRLTDRKRAAILLAAAEQFRACGFEASSMDKIASGAGVSKRTVYNHFPSKEDLFTATLMQLVLPGEAMFELPYRADQPLHAQLLALLRVKVSALGDQAYLDLARIAVAESVHAPERVRPVIEQLSQHEEGICVWIRAAQADGKLIDTDAQFAATLLQGQLKGVAFWPQVTMGMAPLSAHAMEQLITLSASMFLAQFATATAA
jgi:TetR/AcrR family transcriptional regulator of autoinduction and epiphytic fitness